MIEESHIVDGKVEPMIIHDKCVRLTNTTLCIAHVADRIAYINSRREVVVSAHLSFDCMAAAFQALPELGRTVCSIERGQACGWFCVWNECLGMSSPDFPPISDLTCD